VVLAERADAIVVSEGRGAVEAIELLRSESAGRGVFVIAPATEAPASGIVPLGEPLIDRVRPRPGFEGVARSLLGDVYLVDSLEQVFDIYGGGEMPASFVTRDGDVVTRDGVVRGGGQSASVGMLSRVREVRDLEQEVATLDARVEAAASAHAQAETRTETAAQELDNLRNRHHTAAIAMANHEKDLERASERVKTLGEAQQGRVAERADLLAEAEALATEQGELQQRLERSREERVQRQTELDNLGLKLGSVGREVSRLETRVTELKVSHSARIENRNRIHETVERADGSARETQEWIERRRREIEAGGQRRDELVQQQREAQGGLTLKLEAEEEARLKGDGLREAYESQAAHVREFENGLRGVRSELTGRQEEASAAEFTLRESEMRLGHQAETIRERWDVDLVTWQLPSVDDVPEVTAEPAIGETDGESLGEANEANEGGDGSEVGEGESADVSPGDAASALRDARKNAELARAPREDRERELEALRKSLQAMGEVNLGAIEEHEELAERFRFLSEQQGDLEETIESLREAINRINRTSRKRFRETFEAVSKRFSENFPRLFGGGKASLELTDSEDVLEAGIDIMAMPPGKRLQNVNLLSGGEKTMTALALLVAVFQVRPSPFFLLDEVDAALDDANVGRFNQLITEMAVHSQFLVITHNKRTIEVADVLYGVTMEQKGVSKLVAVELH